jgi:lysophospholipase L1-like esterase
LASLVRGTEGCCIVRKLLFLGIVGIMTVSLRADEAKSARTNEPEAPSCSLCNTFTKCIEQKALNICVVGNSVTHGEDRPDGTVDCYYSIIADWLQRHFPDAKVTVRTAIVFAIGPEVQLFRMDEKVLPFAPDLVVTEFGAANGAWGAAGRAVTDPATEGYARRIRLLRPETDILFNLGLFTTMMADYSAGRVPPTVLYLREVASLYDLALADSGGAIAKKIVGGDKWEKYMKDAIHPGPEGYAVHRNTIEAELERQWKLYQAMPPDKRKISTHPLPAKTVAPAPWIWPRLVPAWYADSQRGFVPSENGRVKFIEGGPGAAGKFTADRGRIVGIYFQVGRDSGNKRANVEVRLDGDKWVLLSLENEPVFTEDDDPHNFFRRQFFCIPGLKPEGGRTLEFRVVATPEKRTARIAGFFAIEREGDLGFVRPAK